MKAARTARVTLLVAALSGCEREPEVELPEVELHGEYVSMGIDGDAEPCGGTLPWMDGHVEALGALFGRSVDDVHVDYYWLTTDSVTQLCGADAYACAPPGEVYSAGPLVEHELVHAVLESWVGQGERFFSEGLAVALGDYIFESYPVDGIDRIPEMLGRDRSIDIDYPLAGAFVNELIEVHGASAMLAFYGATSRSDTGAKVATLFEDSFGVPIDAALDTFASRAGGCTMLLPACSQPPLPWDGDAWSHDVEIACTDDALGPDSGPTAEGGKPWRWVSFDIDAPGAYRLELDASAYPLFAHHCGPCGERHESVSFGVLGEAEPVELAAGRYVIRLSGSSGYDRSFSLRVSPGS